MWKEMSKGIYVENNTNCLIRFDQILFKDSFKNIYWAPIMY